MGKIWKNMLYYVSLLLPNILLFNYVIAVVYFFRGNKRFPRSVSCNNATINDYIFHRMISNNWSILHQVCVDKQYAKIFASNSADVHVSRTVSTFSMGEDGDYNEFVEWIRSFIGNRFVAKPAHGAGKVLFLDHEISENEIIELYNYSNRNFFYFIRETQYKNLKKKIIIEENISDKNSINDYKFFCVKGSVMYCQVDVDRFSNHKRAILKVPEFTLIDIRTKFLEIPNNIQRPATLDRMIEISSQLSKDFDFVRIDLYDVDGKIYFGEYTFSPGAACDNFSNEAFAIEFLQRVLYFNGE